MSALYIKTGALTTLPAVRLNAELGRRAGVPISQISKLLGHASIETTQEYLNIELDLDTTISDFVPFFILLYQITNLLIN